MIKFMKSKVNHQASIEETQNTIRSEKILSLDFSSLTLEKKI